ncbi:Glyco_hydro_18 domain-containing protein [Psidium guajava]|nr:Glyco_hydro_18 domain-containing protein [Psidium guajava]
MYQVHITTTSSSIIFHKKGDRRETKKKRNGPIQEALFTIQLVLLLFLFAPPASLSLSSPSPDAVSSLFREYIGALFKGVRFSDVPIRPGVEFHFILSFAIDYDASSSPSPTNGRFNIFWDTNNLTPAQSATATPSTSHPPTPTPGSPTLSPHSLRSLSSTTLTASTSTTRASKPTPDTFAECIGRLISTLKSRGVISFASIAPFADSTVQNHYLALWRRYGHLIDYVNFQFYAYDAGTSVSQFISYFNEQSQNYGEGRSW